MRVFVAFDLPDDIKARVIELEDLIGKKTKRIRFVDKDGLHITIKFLGELPSTALDRVFELLTEESRKFKPFRISLDRVGVFKNLVNPRVLWLGEKNTLYEQFSNAVNEKLDVFRPADNDPFCHLTIGRIRWIEKTDLLNIMRLCNDFLKSEDLSFDVKDFFIYESKLLRSGAVYKKLEKFSLRCDDG